MLAGTTLINLSLQPAFPPEHIVNFVEKRPAEGKVRVSISQPHIRLGYGDRILIHNARLRFPRGYWNPGGFDYQGFMARRGVYVKVSVWRDSFIKIKAGGKGNRVLSLLYAFKERSVEAVEKNMPRREAGILKAMVLGERSGVDQRDRRNFSVSGIAHLLSVSGLHVGFVALSSYFLILLVLKTVMFITISTLKLSFRAGRWASLATILPVVLYVIVVGEKPSAVRAAIMVVSFLTARFLGRERMLYNTLALAALIILILNPAMIIDVGFQLSFQAAFFIVHLIQCARTGSDTEVGSKKTGAFPTGLTNKIKAYLVISIIATLATAPIIGRTFNILSLNNPIANILAVPIANFLVPVGLLACVVNLISESAAHSLFIFSASLTYALKIGSYWLSSTSPLSFNVSTVWTPAVVAYYFLLTGTIAGRRRRFFRLLLAGTMAALGLSFLAPHLKPDAGGLLRVTFLDVGEGDAAVIQFPRGKVMVMDTGTAFRSGGAMGEMVIAPFLKRLGINRIDYLVISHSQLDHAGGAASILKEFEVERLWHNGSGVKGYFNNPLKDRLSSAVAEYKALDDSVPPFYIDGVRVDIPNPPSGAEPGPGGRGRGENRRSIVMRLSHGEFAVLFTGDVLQSTQKRLTRRREKLKATVIKAPHHGAANAVYLVFIAAVNPETSVISTERYNRFRHPHATALAAYYKMGVKTYRTDRDGAVSIISDGHHYRVETFIGSLRTNDTRRLIFE